LKQKKYLKILQLVFDYSSTGESGP
jgi:hypothetical protein